MQKITTFLWFDTEAEEAARFYTSIFPDSRIVETQHYGKQVPDRAGSVMTVAFELAGQRYVALNGGPQFPFTEAISLSVDCASQEEVDDYWAKLTEDGQEVACGWLKDRYGLCWQIVPSILPKLLGDPDRGRAERAMKAMMGMTKLDIQQLMDAADGKGE